MALILLQFNTPLKKQVIYHWGLGQASSVECVLEFCNLAGMHSTLDTSLYDISFFLLYWRRLKMVTNSDALLFARSEVCSWRMLSRWRGNSRSSWTQPQVILPFILMWCWYFPIPSITGDRNVDGLHLRGSCPCFLWLGSQARADACWEDPSLCWHLQELGNEGF